MAVTGAIVALGAYGLTQLRDKYTDTQPIALPQLQLNEEERHHVRTRFDQFRAAVDDGSAGEALILTEDEVNALIAEGDPQNPLIDTMRVEIEDDRIIGRLSLPMDRFGLPMMGGRYLNATADLRASLRDGQLDIRIESATVKGEPLPNQIMSELRRENLASEFLQEPDALRTIRNLESIEVSGGRITIVPRAPGSSDPGDGTPSEAAAQGGGS
jgi:hypothetical protein